MQPEEESTATSAKNWILLVVIIIGILGIAYLWGSSHDTNRPWWKGDQTVLEVNRGLTSQVQAVSNGSEIIQVGSLETSDTACDVQNGTRECTVADQAGVILTLQPLGSE